MTRRWPWVLLSLLAVAVCAVADVACDRMKARVLAPQCE